YIDGFGRALCQQVCELDLEGIVAKQKFGAYVAEREQSTWFKILNRKYSQKDGREEMFERERHQEPVAGWHACALACAELNRKLLCQKTAKLLKCEIQQMWSAIPVQERLMQNALIVELSCANRRRKHAASVTAYSVLPAYPSIRCSTPKLRQQITGKFGNEKELKTAVLWLREFRAFSSP